MSLNLRGMLRQSLFAPLSLFFAFALSTAGCGGSDSANIELRVVSDLVPELEVGTATAVLYEGVATANNAGLGSVERNVVTGEPLARGLWLATFERVPHGTYTVWTTLRRQNGEVLGRQPITFVVSGDASYTVTITADCVGVECPGGGNAGFLACVAGVCVDPRCSPETPEHCPSEEDLFCDTAESDCVAQMPCGVAVCESGVCLQVPSASECGEGEFCSALSGCTAEERPPEAPEDPAGPCGDACALLDQPCKYAFIVCENATGCTPFANREAGSPCPNEGVCNAEGECVEGARGDAGVADASVTDMDIAGDGGVLFDMSVTSDADVFDASIDMSAMNDAEVSIDMGATPCADGYAGTVETGCVDINECRYRVCDPLTTCTNTPGSFTCSACPPDYAGTGETGCVRANACDDDPCDALTVCNPTGTGTFECSACPSGYLGTGERGCFDINECSLGACEMHTACTNLPGTFSCGACVAGFTDDGSGGCRDVDECALRTDTCTSNQHCANSVGSYECRRAIDVVAGYYSTCALFEGGLLKCWGENYYAQLGYGDSLRRDAPGERPIALGAEGDITQIVSGEDARFCALLADGNVTCWGANDWSGTLGYGEDGPRYVPAGNLDLGAGRRATNISASGSHICVVLNDGELKCWGENASGQLGYGDTTTRRVPEAATIDLGAGRKAVSVKARRTFSCALLDDGAVKCWGSNDYGQLGYGDQDARSAPPDNTVDLGAGRVATSIAMGEYFVCALLDDGSVKCWGNNGDGQLGYGDQDSRSQPEAAPIDLGAGRFATQIAAGNSHTCAILDDESVKCWGANHSGALGVGYVTYDGMPGEEADHSPRATGIDFGEGRVARRVSAGARHTCALLDDDSLRCWGDNEYGQVGYGHPSNRTLADSESIDFGAGRRAISMASGGSFTCAVLDDGAATCWGDNEYGQLGLGDYLGRNAPAASRIAFGAGRRVQAIAAGGVHACALLDDGSVECWGQGWEGQLGDDERVLRPEPNGTSVNLGVGRTAKAIAASQYYSCAILDDDTIKCWGDNGSGQLGYGDRNMRGVPDANPIHLGSGRTAKAMSLGPIHACAILDNDSVKCWGTNSYGVLGYGDSTPRYAPAVNPINLGAGRTARSISIGTQYSTCALLDDASVKCWGYNEHGVLGYGDQTHRSAPDVNPISFGPGRSATSIEAGYLHTCAMLDDGSARCWGRNDYYDLGYRDNTQRLAPSSNGLDFGGGRQARTILPGYVYSTCALLDDDTATCWGENSNGELGYGLHWAPASYGVNLKGR